MAHDASPDPATAVRAVAYIRVSKAHDDTISPDLQLRSIKDHCERHGYVLTEKLQDLDLSGRIWKHRQMERAIRMIEDDQADVIVVWRWSRVSRNRLDWAVAVDRVEAIGGQLESATEAFDVSTSTGRLARGILAELAAFESDRQGDLWREVAARRVAQGLPSQGQNIFGYRKRPDGHYVPDRRTAPILAELYNRYICGATFTELARWLNSHHVATIQQSGASEPWTKRLSALMDRGFAAGCIRSHGELLPGAHEPVISAAVWEAYQAQRERTRNGPRRPPAEFLAVGLLACYCGQLMYATRNTTKAADRYQCLKHPPGQRGKSILRARLDGMLYTWLTALAYGHHVGRQADLQAWDRAQAQARRASAVREEVTRTTDVEQRASLLQDLDQLRAPDTTPFPSVTAAALLEDWDVLENVARRARLRALIRRVTARSLRATPVLTICTTWDTELPWTGVQTRTAPSRPPARAFCADVNPAGESEVDPLQLLTPAEAARITGVKVHTLRSWDVAGHLPNTHTAPDGSDRRYAIRDLRRMKHRYKSKGVWVPVR
ncbi:recombinase family protein [Geodermatophilus sp. CPCC 206100]|uniref:recombinase family protein n=1 Tax=Geodermatophilus sp. CPCC 206100 TaxID=3020054 RepID=UPI003B0069B0